MAFEFKKLDIPDVLLIKPKVFSDVRGFFFESYRRSEFIENGITDEFIQNNHSSSKQGVLRGLHYQLNPYGQAKLIRVVKGEVFDLAVDIRKGSPTYGKWVGQNISAQNKEMLYIPEGFAHGFCVLSDSADLIYLCSKEYNAQADRGIIWNDPDLSINWPIKEPILSNKDLALPSLAEAENNFTDQSESQS